MPSYSRPLVQPGGGTPWVALGLYGLLGFVLYKSSRPAAAIPPPPAPPSAMAAASAATAAAAGYNLGLAGNPNAVQNPNLGLTPGSGVYTSIPSGANCPPNTNLDPLFNACSPTGITQVEDEPGGINDTGM